MVEGLAGMVVFSFCGSICTNERDDRDRKPVNCNTLSTTKNISRDRERV